MMFLSNRLHLLVFIGSLAQAVPTALEKRDSGIAK
jgi:hypothetical protein